MSLTSLLANPEAIVKVKSECSFSGLFKNSDANLREENQRLIAMNRRGDGFDVGDLVGGDVGDKLKNAIGGFLKKKQSQGTKFDSKMQTAALNEVAGSEKQVKEAIEKEIDPEKKKALQATYDKIYGADGTLNTICGIRAGKKDAKLGNVAIAELLKALQDVREIRGTDTYTGTDGKEVKVTLFFNDKADKELFQKIVSNYGKLPADLSRDTAEQAEARKILEDPANKPLIDALKRKLGLNPDASITPAEELALLRISYELQAKFKAGEKE